MALRIAVAVPFKAIHYDEIWQYIEPAWSLIDDHWVRTWEQRLGARSWLLPTVLAAPMWIGHHLTPHGTGHLLAVREFLALVSLALVYAFYRFGRAVSPSHALIALAVGALWPEFIFMAPRALSENLSAVAFVGGACILILKGQDRRWAAVSGAVLGLSVLFRFQLAPAVAALLLISRRDFQILPFFAGGLSSLAIDAAANALAGVWPFQWVYLNAYANSLQGRSNVYGVSPPWYYLADLLTRWHVFLLPIACCAFIGGRRYPALMAAALTHLAIHSLVPHKEWRFDYLFVVLVLLLAAIGTGDVVQRLRERSWHYPFCGAVGLWLLACGAVAGNAIEPVTSQYLSGTFWRMRWASVSRCPIGIVSEHRVPNESYALKNTRQPMYLFPNLPQSLAAFDRSSGAFGVVISNRANLHLPQGFSPPRCIQSGDLPRSCVMINRSTCIGKPPEDYEINRVIERYRF